MKERTQESHRKSGARGRDRKHSRKAGCPGATKASSGERTAPAVQRRRLTEGSPEDAVAFLTPRPGGNESMPGPASEPAQFPAPNGGGVEERIQAAPLEEPRGNLATGDWHAPQERADTAPPTAGQADAPSLEVHPTASGGQSNAAGSRPAASPAAPGGGSPPATSGSAMTPPMSPGRFLVTTYRDGGITKTPATLAEILCLDDADDVDAHVNEATGRIVIRPQFGPPLPYPGRIPGVGPDVGRVLLEQLMWRPGQFLTVEDLLKLLALASFDAPDARAVCVTRLLTAFGENREQPWFFELAYQPWRIKWRATRSWRIIERLA